MRARLEAGLSPQLRRPFGSRSGGSGPLTARRTVEARASGPDRRGRAGFREQQAGVAELVPQVAAGQRGGVGASHQLRPGHRLQQQQVRRLGLVPAGDQPVDDPGGPVRARAPGRSSRAPACTAPSGVGHRLQRAGHGGADRDHPPARRPRRVHRGGRRRGHRVALGQRLLAGLEGGRRRCAASASATATPRRCSPRQHGGRERTGGAGHLGAGEPVAVAAGEHGAVVVERPRSAQVAVGDRAAERAPASSAARPRPGSGPATACCPSGGAGRGARRAGTPSRRRAAGRLARRAVADPAAVRACAARRSSRRRPAGGPRDVQHHRTAVGAGARRRAAGSVAESLTTTRSPRRSTPGSPGTRGVATGVPARATSSRTPSRGTPRASGGAVGRQLGRHGERSVRRRWRSRGHDQVGGAVAADWRAARRAAAGTPGRRSRARAGRRCPRPGTRAGAWPCACRRGRTRRRRRSGSSTPSTAA